MYWLVLGAMLDIFALVIMVPLLLPAMIMGFIGAFRHYRQYASLFCRQ